MRATFKRFCSIAVLCVSFKLHIVKVRVIRLRRYGSKERSLHIYVHLRSSVHVQLKYKKNYILLISWKSLFSSLNRDDWYIFCTRCLCVSISFTFYCYSIILMASLAFFRRKQCTLLTTLEMGKINNYFYIFGHINHLKMSSGKCCSLRSKHFCLVTEQRKTKEG